MGSEGIQALVGRLWRSRLREYTLIMSAADACGMMGVSSRRFSDEMPMIEFST